MLTYLADGHQAAKWLELRNLARLYDFMTSSFVLWQIQQSPPLTIEFVRELNFYAAHHLAPAPGTLRSVHQCNVKITDTDHVPPPFEQVDALMEDFIQTVHNLNQTEVPSYVAAYALWRLNWIHPFAQGNGRTSRAVCFFILCQRYNLWFPGTPILPELIRRDRAEYCALLTAADKTIGANGLPDLTEIQAFLELRLQEQMSTVQQESLQEEPAAAAAS